MQNPIFDGAVLASIKAMEFFPSPDLIRMMPFCLLEIPIYSCEIVVVVGNCNSLI